METLSVELHAQIFDYACTDDGSTARSLSLVSRYMREVVRPFLYQSLVVSGFDQMSELEARIRHLPPYLRRIRHLFLSGRKKSQVAEERDIEHREVEESLAKSILTLAAPTLEALTLITSFPLSSTSMITYLFSLSLPQLCELSIKGFYPFPSKRLAMPRLERLHLSGIRNPHGLLGFGALDAACPSLTHLRISGLVSAVSFACELREALHPERSTPLRFPATLPRTIEHVVVQSGSFPKGFHQYSAARMGHAEMAATLEELLLAAEDTEVKFTLSCQNDDTYEGMLRSWTDRLGNGEGCWSTQASRT
ncbi:uncharacterized protein LAESUDRAFT_730711 [Laetiporus sulphureus 93-53]|uniref:F-box domain-containing protein n=1 Tax=Laetiporus sulphureus 93-53 TaxID=1314785 RepID=A0A165C0X7_9APHY|nr:uncharacterized protein LAESUDRAFT_730711 [Laetiporus sulphureus 93-53]KZT02002.1 hypothetical protein LAESUDRAFT_730711 [Laetiporus sulphureus 93-53]